MYPLAKILLFLFTLTLLPLQAQRPARPGTTPPPPPAESSARNSIDYNRAFSQVKDNRKKVADIVSRLVKEKPSASRDIIRGAIDALRDDPEYVSLLDGLIKSAIAAAPDQLANIVSAAATASPESARTIVSAAIAITGGAAASQENLTTILNAAIEGAPNRRESIYDAAMDAAPNRVWDPLRFPGEGIDVNTAGVSGRFPDAPPTDLAGNNPLLTEKPVINEPFTAGPNTITSGGSTTLSWGFSNVTNVTISPGIGTVDASGKIMDSPTETTTYTITATNPSGETITQTQTVTVTTVPPASITSFTANPATITSGNSSTLSWSTTGATSLSIDNGVGEVTGTTSRVVTPGTTTTYTLTATNAAGTTVTQTVTVTVVPLPTITFTANPTGILADGVSTSTLSWTVTGATTVSIDNGIGDVAATGSTVVKPAVSTDYILTATNAAGDSLQRNRRVEVIPLPPEVISFTGTPIVITAGDSVEFEWVVVGADEISIDQGVGLVTAVGSTSVTPEPDATEVKTVTYTITAMNGSATITENVTVTINPRRPAINSFTASPSTIDEGGSTTLIWSTSNATSVQIVDDKGNDFTGLAANSSLAIPSLSETTTYTLTASNAIGDEVPQQVTVLVDPLLPVIVSFGAEEHPELEGVFILSWDVTGADTVEITNVGFVPPTGSTLVSPTEDTDYTLIATNSAGSIDSDGNTFPRSKQATRTVRVTVKPRAERKPVINSFTASPGTIVEGQTSTLSWSVTNATSVTITGISGALNPSSGTTNVTPAANTIYTLTATNANGSVTRSVLVTVLPPEAPPVINSFTASPGTIVEGQTSTLSWSVTNATSVTITGISGALNPSSGTITTPALTQTTTYTLEATNGSGQVDRQAVRVTVVAPTAPPSIASFTATPQSIITGDASTLAWSVVNADTVTIDQGIGPVATTGTRPVNPIADTTYTLTATNAGGTVTRTVKVSVAPLQPPTITAFTANPSVLTVGDTSTLSWEVLNATTVSLSPNVGLVSGSGSNTVLPIAAGTYTYTLLAINKSGPVSRSVSVRVNSPVAPSIVSFTASPAAIVAGDSSILSWQVINADTVSISPQPGTVSLSRSAGVSPTATQTYTLTATKGALTTTRQVTVTVTAPAQPPVIASFTASPSTIIRGDSTTLSWDVATDSGSPLTSLTITPGVAAAGNSGSVSVSPTANTTYTLTATNSAGTVTRTVTVIVNEPDRPPLITSFTASPGSIFEGESSILAWDVSGADSVTISPSVGSFSTGSGSFSVSPSVTTTYTLTAFKQGSQGGLTSTRQVTITVKIVQPKIQFTVSPPAIFVGESATLSWTVTGADPGTISISPAIGSVGATGTQSVNPTVTTSYTITASNADGVSTFTVILTVVPSSSTLVDPSSSPPPPTP
ncbi:MAG: hypothetical protein FJ385_01270 [Verrucomicrobia bacterium]|nr:hypothetical protein [Verrucomicrobiota bacterium]